jgi:pimeloyl-ACP methyl ester carboxylesterase
MRTIRIASLVLPLALLANGTALAAECGKLATQSGVVGYCIDEADRTKNPDILYYLHGAFPPGTPDPEQAGLAPGNDLLKFWPMASLERPTIITLSWGPTWVLKDDKLTAFEREVVPQLEARLTSSAAGRRMVLGTSMGGLSAFLAWTRLPQLFQAAAFQCPAFTPFSPFANGVEKLARAGEIAGESARGVVKQIKDTPGRFEQLDLFGEIFSPHFSSTEEWLAYQPPLAMKALAGRALAPAYLVHNAQDQFGFNGAPEIAASGHAITYERQSGKHCADGWTIGLAKFLSGYPADPAGSQ